MRKLYTWTNEVNWLFWARVVNSTNLDVRSLSAFRIVLGSFLLATFIPSYSWIAEAPQALFNPPVLSIANFFNGFPSSVFFIAIDCLIIFSLVCLTIGIKARVSTLVFLITWIIGLSFKFSFGKIDHSSVLLSALLLCMAFSGWGRHLAILPDKKSNLDSTSKSLALLSVLLCFAMFTAGILKAFNWLDFDIETNGFLSWYRNGFYGIGRQYLLAPYVKYFPAVLVEFFDYAAVVFELSPLLFLLHSRKGWRLWLLIACSFHLSNTLMLNIMFVLNSMVYIVFMDYTWLYNKLQRLLAIPHYKYILTGSIVTIGLLRILNVFEQDVLFSSFLFNGVWTAKYWFDLTIWGVAIILIIKNLKLQSPSEDIQKHKQESAMKAPL
ncbi:hypothetical protein ACMA1I_22220 [Pontibacter sp. 13R65]|uniref:hypothetical protein n=1 Tax=Pontibacter sp. 13R65 TaxID=3127458 RepID=UPI00301E0C8D